MEELCFSLSLKVKVLAVLMDLDKALHNGATLNVKSRCPVHL